MLKAENLLKGVKMGQEHDGMFKKILPSLARKFDLSATCQCAPVQKADLMGSRDRTLPCSLDLLSMAMDRGGPSEVPLIILEF